MYSFLGLLSSLTGTCEATTGLKSAWVVASQESDVHFTVITFHFTGIICVPLDGKRAPNLDDITRSRTSDGEG